MIIPIRCFTCNNIIGSKWNKYLQLISEKNIDMTDNIMNINQDTNSMETLHDNSDIFEKLNVSRYCCKRHLLGHVDILHKL